MTKVKQTNRNFIDFEDTQIFMNDSICDKVHLQIIIGYYAQLIRKVCCFMTDQATTLPKAGTGIVLIGEPLHQNTKSQSNNVLQTAQEFEPLDSPYHRQGLIPWWRQSVVRNAKIFVMGAGAIGNETLKNLALLGVSNIFICDMDTIEMSNLSRTLLFRRGDEDKLKAEVAAQRLKEMSPDQDFKVDYFCGDVMYELGIGLFRRFDIVLGCLDNDATRFFIDKQCALFNKPWINAGIGGLNWTLQVVNSQKSACFHCGYSPEIVTQIISRKASCGKTIVSDLNEGKIPTVQVASAFVSALQSQEAIKVLHKQYSEDDNNSKWGVSYSYQGASNEYSKSKMLFDNKCQNHGKVITDEEIIEFHSATNEITLREFLLLLKEDGRFSDEFELDLSEEPGREFVTQLYCVFCGDEIEIGMPRYKLKREHTLCENCNDDMANESALICNTVKKFSLSHTPDDLLNLSLKDIGVPKLHILMIVDKNDGVHYVELSGDLLNVLPNIASE